MTSNCPMQGVSLSKTWKIEGELLFCDVDKLGQSTSYVRHKTLLYHTQSLRYSESSCSCVYDPVLTDILGLFAYTVTLR